jgi:hypothetical protein
MPRSLFHSVLPLGLFLGSAVIRLGSRVRLLVWRVLPVASLVLLRVLRVLLTRASAVRPHARASAARLVSGLLLPAP